MSNIPGEAVEVVGGYGGSYDLRPSIFTGTARGRTDYGSISTYALFSLVNADPGVFNHAVDGLGVFQDVITVSGGSGQGTL